MTGCTFLLARNSPIRTTLTDEATGQAVYQIDTPRKLSQYVTKIKKLDSTTQPPLYLDDDGADSDSSEDITDKKQLSAGTEEGEPETELPGTSDEMARIYWKFISSDRIVFRGKITTQSEFLPAAGKLQGWVILQHTLFGSELSPPPMPGVSPSLGRMAFSTDGRWVPWG